MNKVKLFTCLLACMAALSGRAAVTGVTYGITYDTVNCRWNMYMKVLAGTATGRLERTASTAKLTIVIPTLLTVGTTVYANEPKVGSVSNNVITRTNSASGWTLANPYAPTSGPLTGYTVYDYNVTTSNAFWPQMAPGDSITLFALDIPTVSCGSDIRLWNNNIIQSVTQTGGDPISALMNGKDYNNGISMNANSVIQTFTGAIPTVGPPKPKVTASRSLTSNSIQLSANVIPGSHCSNITSYEWTGPNGFTANGANVTVTPITAASFGTYSITATDNKGCFSNLSLATIPLPVTLTKFGGSADKCAAVLNWNTASEVSFDRFDVQYSTDGASFQTIGKIASKKAQGGSEYSYNYAQNSGKGLYRLKMIDLNGTFTYSETISVQTNCGSSAGEIVIAPNPTSGNVSIRGIKTGADIRIMDMLGKVVANEVSTGTSISVDLSRYANGIYNVLVSQNGGWEKVGQIVKN